MIWDLVRSARASWRNRSRRIPASGLTAIVVLVAASVAVFYWRKHRRKQAELGSDPDECSSAEPEPAKSLPPVADPVQQHVGNVEEVV